jgi:cysteine synthase A
MVSRSDSYDSILSAVGNTPLLKLSRMCEPNAGAVYIKLEHHNPTGSHKDRLANAILERAEREGRLKPGGTVVEASCGSMAVSLALACAIKGYSLIAVLPRTVIHEHRALLLAYRARIELTDAREGMRGALDRAVELAREIPGAFFAAQHENTESLAAQRDGTGAELLQTIRADGRVPNAFVSTVGTGASLAGVGAALKRAFPGVERVAVGLQGIDSDQVRATAERAGLAGIGAWRGEFDRLLEVSTGDLWRTQSRLAKEEGLLAGPSTGANVWASLRLARELGPGGNVYTLCFDTGERYFSAQEPS